MGTLCRCSVWVRVKCVHTVCGCTLTHKVHLYHGVRLRQRVHAMVISRSAVIHAERLPIEPQPTAHTMGYRRESSRLHIVQPPLYKGS